VYVIVFASFVGE